jgi:hypothetical protein
LQQAGNDDAGQQQERNGSNDGERLDDELH